MYWIKSEDKERLEKRGVIVGYEDGAMGMLHMCALTESAKLYLSFHRIEHGLEKSIPTVQDREMVFERSWNEFRDARLLWWVNRMIHLFGWALVYEADEEGKITRVYPARVKFRGFDEKNEEIGFIGLTEHLKANIEDLVEETKA